MLNVKVLEQKLNSIDQQDYGAYQSLKGSYDFGPFTLIMKQIPKDPYAPPHTGIYCIQINRQYTDFPQIELSNRTQKIAYLDYLNRRFFDCAHRISKGIRGTGFSGEITINKPSQAILERNSIVIKEDILELRCFVGLPAEGRKIKAKVAAEMLFTELPAIVEESMMEKHFDHPALQNHIQIAEDEEFIRNSLEDLNLIAFIGEGSILPRESGTSDKPMAENQAIPFSSPDSMKINLKLPHRGSIGGMGIPKGITLISGGGYHGKSTLLQAIAAGVYNHIPGDGREWVISRRDTVKVRAYSGRSVVQTNISTFIKNLPFHKDTTAFSTKNASGSTSQAANIIEAIEAGSRVLLMDEDTCATNFMIRDHKMQQLVAKDQEPITCFIDKVKQLFEEKDVSTILVLGGIGDYFEVAHQVIQMVEYKPEDVTQKALDISRNYPVHRISEEDTAKIQGSPRCPLGSSITPESKYGKFRVYAKETRRIFFGEEEIDLGDVEQIIELSQTKALGFALAYAKQYMDEKTPIIEIIKMVESDIQQGGLDIISQRISGHFAQFRPQELAFVLNRYCKLKVNQKAGKNF